MVDAARRAVYTAVFGGYEKLHDQAVAFADADIPFICFTDDPEFSSESWDIRVVAPRFGKDLVRSARYLKIMGHPDLDQFEETLWIDNTVDLRVPASQILDDWLDGFDIAMPLHSYRRSVVAEFDAIAEVGYDDPDRVYEQLLHYLAMAPKLLEERPYWTALLARRHGPEVQRAMRLWMDHILRYSRRDQLSVRAALNQSKVVVNAIEIDNFESDMHRWPAKVDRNWGIRESRFQDALRPPAADLGRLQNESDQLIREIDHKDSTIKELQERCADLENIVEAMRSSRSWRITSGLRRIKRPRHGAE